MQLLTGKLPTLMNSFSNRKYLLLPSHIGTFDVISGLCSVKLSLYIIRKRTITITVSWPTKTSARRVVSVGMERLELSRHYWHQILSLECLHSTTPPINPGFIHLKETKETLAKNLQDPQSLRIRYPFQQPGWWAVGGEGLEPPNPNGSGLWNVVDSNYH